MRKLSSYGPSLIVLATVAVLLVAGPSIVRRLTYHQTQARIQLASQRLDDSSVLEELNTAYRDLATVVEPSVVHISTERIVRDRFSTRTVTSAGSGWIFDTEGHIVTNFHVIQDAERIDVQMHSGEIWPADIVGSDQFTDIAVIRVDTKRVHPAVLADDDHRVVQGDLVFAFGSPFDFRFSMSSGVVSGVGRYVGVIRDARGIWGYENFIQVDAAINPGNSGGPLTDIRGRVIGMNTAIATGSRRSGSFEEGQFAGIGLAIPIEMIRPVVSQLIETRMVQKGFLGVSVSEVPGGLSAEFARHLRAGGFVERGLGVDFVDPAGPASAAGVRLFDVIRRVNDDEVYLVNHLRSRISSMLPGDEVDLEIWRYDVQADRVETFTVTITIGRLDTRRTMGILPQDQRRDSLDLVGIARMDTSTEELARRYEVEYVPGVLVMDVLRGSAIDGRVPPGSILVEVNGQHVPSVDALFELLATLNLSPGREVHVRFVLPDGRPRPLRLMMP